MQSKEVKTITNKWLENVTNVWDRVKELAYYLMNSFLSDDDDQQNIQKSTGCVLTENGKCHLLFDLMSLSENCVLLITGAFYIGKYETDFDPYKYQFCAVVLGTHVFGLLLKFLYYQFQHPWMTLSLARDCMGKVSKAIICLLGVCTVVGIPIIAHLISPSTTSTVLYILMGFCSFMVRTTKNK